MGTTTTTGTISAGANDGWANNGGFITNGANYIPLSNSAGTLQGGWLRFTNITIPQSATINTATLKLYITFTGGGGSTRNIAIDLDSRSAPGNPTQTYQVINPLYYIGAGISTPINQFTGPATSTISYDLHNINVKSLVQTLVNNYSYSNGEMVFYINDKIANPSFGQICI